MLGRGRDKERSFESKESSEGSRVQKIASENLKISRGISRYTAVVFLSEIQEELVSNKAAGGIF